MCCNIDNIVIFYLLVLKVIFSCKRYQNISIPKTVESTIFVNKSFNDLNQTNCQLTISNIMKEWLKNFATFKKNINLALLDRVK